MFVAVTTGISNGDDHGIAETTHFNHAMTGFTVHFREIGKRIRLGRSVTGRRPKAVSGLTSNPSSSPSAQPCGLTPDSHNENEGSQYESDPRLHLLGIGLSKLFFSNSSTLA